LFKFFFGGGGEPLCGVEREGNFNPVLIGTVEFVFVFVFVFVGCFCEGKEELLNNGFPCKVAELFVLLLLSGIEPELLALSNKSA